MLVAVNLMPPDRRPRESTPLAVLLPALAFVVLFTFGSAYWVRLRFYDLASAATEESDLVAAVAAKQPALKYLVALREEQADFEKRTKTIKEIAASRVLWTKKLDEFFDVAVDDEDGLRYLVWLDRLEVKPVPAHSVGKKDAKGDQLVVKGRALSDGDVLQRFNVFHAALRSSAFFNPDFAEINDPAGKSEELTDGRKPSRAWTVDLAMSMKPRVPEPAKPAPKPAPGKLAEKR